MSKSSIPRRRTKHTDLLPYPDFPLSPHVPTRRWYKVVQGRRHYFGPLDDWQAALAEYQRVRDFLQTGRTPPPTGGLALRDLANQFLTAKQNAVNDKSLTLRSFRDYHHVAALLIEHLGRERAVDDLRAEDFTALRAALAKSRGPHSQGNLIRRTRTIFKWAYDSGLIDKPVRFGPEFHVPTRAVMRRHRASTPQRMFSAPDLRQILTAATMPLKAMILLGVNCGLGNTDIAELPISALDLKQGILNFPRPKTGIERRATLWPDTVKALRAALAARPNAKHSADGRQVFLTRCGERWVRCQTPGPRAKKSIAVNVDAVGLEFSKLLRRLDIKQPGVSFYALRHVFETIAGELADQPAVDRIMGHESPDVRNHYREWQGDDRENQRLRKVTDHVHQWLFNSRVRLKSGHQSIK